MTTQVLQVPRIFSVCLQDRGLDCSLSFYQDTLGLGADRDDDTLAMLCGRGDSGHTLVFRQSGGTQHGLGDAE